MQLDKYSGCMKCGAKVVTDAAHPEIGTCVKCKMMQCINAGKEEFSAHIMVKAQTCIPLRAFGKVVEDICQYLFQINHLLTTATRYMVDIERFLGWANFRFSGDKYLQ